MWHSRWNYSSEAADKGKLEAMSTLGYIYDFGGYGVERNIKKVLLWRKKEFEEHFKFLEDFNEQQPVWLFK